MSSFDFNWSTNEKPASGKVFAKKRKPKPAEPSKKSTSPVKLLKAPLSTNKEPKPNQQKTILPSPSNNNKESQDIPKTSFPATNFAENETEHSNKFIKRKQKKDKQAQIVTPNANNDHSLFNVRHKDIYVNTSQGKSVSEKVFSGGSFGDLGIHRHLVSNLEKNNFKVVTNVQAKSIPVMLKGNNTLVRSQTGSGKTLAYAVPIIDSLQGIDPYLKRGDGVQAIIVVPTRELALQTQELFSKINTFQRIVVGHLCGGENRRSEKERLRKGLHVLIGTPGRLLDHVLHTAAMKIDTVRCLVLDEADRLLDMGFRKDIISLVEALDKAKDSSTYNPLDMLKGTQSSIKTNEIIETDSDLPPLKDPKSKLRQTVLLSATLTKGVSELVEFTMKEHTYIDGLEQTSNATADSFVIPDTVQHECYITHSKHRLFTLSALLLGKSKTKCTKIFVFMATTQMVEFHYELLKEHFVKMPVNRGKFKNDNNMDSDSDDDKEEVVVDLEFFKLHGNMDQNSRKEVFNGFRKSTKGVLICTDVAARGLDIPLADCIIQYNGPQTDEDYLHRVGRTGRAGQKGTAIIFLTHEEQGYVTHLRDHRVFLKKKNEVDVLKHLSLLMEEPDHERAATALQNHFEAAVENNKALYKKACFAYSSWSRFYNAYPAKMRTHFDFKAGNLGHYVTSFALKESPTNISKIVKGHVVADKPEETRLNMKLANHGEEIRTRNIAKEKKKKKKAKSISLSVSEFSSGLEPRRKKFKNNA